jgi:hypothetical protein
MLLPWRALFAHGLRTREPLTHTRGQGDFGGLSCTAPTRIDALADRMVPHGHQGAHRPHGAPLSPAPPDGPLAPQGATIPVARGDAHQGRELLPAAGPPRRAVGNQRRREDWADAGGARALVVWLPPHGAGPHGCAQVLVQRRATTLPPREVRLAVGLNCARGAAQAILLGGAPGEPRAPPGQRGAERLGLGLRYGPRRRPPRLGNVGQAVGLPGRGRGPPARGMGHIPGVAGSAHHDGPPCGRPGSSDGHVEATGGFQDPEERLAVLPPGHQGGDAGVIRRHAPPRRRGPLREIYGRFGDLDPDAHGALGPA